jgi:hypothetical protein
VLGAKGGEVRGLHLFDAMAAIAWISSCPTHEC